MSSWVSLFLPSSDIPFVLCFLFVYDFLPVVLCLSDRHCQPLSTLKVVDLDKLNHKKALVSLSSVDQLDQIKSTLSSTLCFWIQDGSITCKLILKGDLVIVDLGFLIVSSVYSVFKIKENLINFLIKSNIFKFGCQARAETSKNAYKHTQQMETVTQHIRIF